MCHKKKKFKYLFIMLYQFIILLFSLKILEYFAYAVFEGKDHNF